MLMKKLISTLAAVALVFTMAMPVMAAESPEPHGQDIVPNGSVDGYYVRISDPNPTDYALEVLPDAAAVAVGEDVLPECSLDAVDVDIVNLQGTVVNDQYFASNSSLLVTFVRNSESEVLAVLYWNDATQSWDSAWFQQDGTIVHVLLNHLCTVVFVVKSDEPGSAVSVPTAEETGIDIVASAQTGYATGMYGLIAVVALIGAVVCFKTSKKSAISAD